MFDFAFSEMLLAALVALVVLGPERLPQAARAAGRMAGKLQRLAGSLKAELAQHTDMADLRRMQETFALFGRTGCAGLGAFAAAAHAGGFRLGRRRPARPAGCADCAGLPHAFAGAARARNPALAAAARGGAAAFAGA